MGKLRLRWCRGVALVVLGVLVVTGCGPRINKWEPVRYALSKEDLGVEIHELQTIRPFYGSCPAPVDTMGVELDNARIGGGVAEAMRAAIDSGQQVQSFVMDLGPRYASALAAEGGATSDNVTTWVGQDVEEMQERLDCEPAAAHIDVETIGALSYDEIEYGVVTEVFGFSAQARGPWRQEVVNPGSDLTYAPSADISFPEGVVPEDQRYWLDARYTVVKGTVIVGVEVVSTHEDRLDADELLQTVVDRLEADTLPTRAPAETRRTS